MFEGLLSGLLGPMDEHKRNAFLMAAAQALQSKGGTGNAIGSALQGGLLGYQSSRGLEDKRKEEEQQREMRTMQMEQMRRANADQAAIGGVYSRNTMPGNLAPNDDEGNPMPAAPQGINVEGLKSGLLASGPAGLREYANVQGMFKKEQPKYHVVGNALVPEPQSGQAQSQPAYTAPEKPDGPKKGQIREIKSGGNLHTYEFDGKQWQKIASAPQFKPDEPTKPPQGYEPDPARPGALRFVVGGPADPAGGKPTDTERVAAGYASRMQSAEKIMSPIEQTSGKPGVRESILTGFGRPGEALANALPEISGGRSADRQSYRQAQEDWVRAKLRKESGAVIADQEMDREIRTYFPQIGDTPQVIKQKASSRKVAVDAMRTGAGPVMPPNVDDLLRKYGVR